MDAGGAHARRRGARVAARHRAAPVFGLLWALLALAPGPWLGAADASTVLRAPDRSRAVLVGDSPAPPPGHRLSSHEVLAIAARQPLMGRLVRRYPGAFSNAYLKGAQRWQVSYFVSTGRREIGQLLISDRDGRVLEQWTGPQVGWTMARGYPGAFGAHVNALYLWIPLSLMFVLPFVRWRRPLSWRNLDLVFLSLFSVSLAFFNRADVATSVPLAYPGLIYLLVRLLIVARLGRRAPTADVPAPLLTMPVPVVAFALVFLIGFRVALNVTDANVIDVGYAGVIGAHRIVQGQPLYGHWPANNAHGDTYGPVTYEAYIPFVALLGFSGRWDDLPAAHLAASVFDLLALALCFLLGRRARGPTLGLALAYAWAAYPFTLYALSANSNDALVAALVLGALLVCSSPVRGTLAVLAGLAKFAPLALAPLLATDAMRRRGDGGRGRALGAFTVAFGLAGLLALAPALAHGSLRTIYERTLVYQANRGSPFSVWGLYGGLQGAHVAVEIVAALLAGAVALAPRREDLVGTAAAAGAVLIAVQIGLDHWFYLYIPWFFPLAMLALLGGAPLGAARAVGGASEPARSSRLVVA